jgi:TonB family protein
LYLAKGRATKKGDSMRKKQVSFVSLGCLVALILNPLTSLAQGVVQPRQAPDKPVWVTVTDDAKTIERTYDFVIADGQERIQGGGVEVVTTPAGTMTFFASEMSFDTHIVKGKPFSAVAVSEATQALVDGNRIVRRTSSNLYRDSEGRTRREQSLATVGPFTTADDSAQRVFINDPVAGVNYVLNPRAQTAQKNSLPQVRVMTATAGVGPLTGVSTATATTTNSATTTTMTVVADSSLKVSGGAMQTMAMKRPQPEYPAVAKAAGAEGTVKVQITVDENGQVVDAVAVDGHPLLRQAAIDAAKQWQFKAFELGGKPAKVQGVITFNFTLDKSASGVTAGKMVAATAPPVVFERTPFSGGERMELKSEPLGKRTFDGVEAEGTRTVSTIPAGAIGNERPIEIVSERWYSAELQTVVMTRHSDPRTGDNVYRLENINRSEPQANLFQVPSDYTLSEPVNMIRKKLPQ